MISFCFGFFLGVLAVLGIEAWILFRVIDRLRRKSAEAAKPPGDEPLRDLDGEQSLSSILGKQGLVWVLEPEKIPKLNVDESSAKGPKELKNKKNIVEVCPVKKYAKIKEQSLILSDPDGTQRTIELVDCTIAAVSASDLSSRKWAKRYPIRLEGNNSILYNGSKTCYIYFETSWEKESWCKALRLASCPDTAKLNWFARISGEFHKYLMSLNAEYPSFLKPPEPHDEVPDKTNRVDVSSSKVRGFLKKLRSKASKNGVPLKSASVSLSTRGERRTGEKTRSLHDFPSADEPARNSLEKTSNNSLADLFQSGSSASGKSLLQIIPDPVCSEKILRDDEGTLCWNLLFSRLFFDAKRSIGLNEALKTRIQRTLSNMRTPGYIGSVTCTGLDLGDLPPFIRRMRVLPVDLSEIWAMEVDIEYSGGIVLDVETRIEVGEQELQKDELDISLGLSSSMGATSDLHESIDHHGKQLVIPSNSADKMENRDEGDALKQLKSTKRASNYSSRWKAAVHSFANKVAQVPISLAIRIASLRGTLRLHIKPPPSDQLWFGFTCMPEIEWNLDSSVGDQKITSSHVALLIGNRFKASIRETLVLPNCESVCIPWMLAEKDDWVPRSVAPFIWINQEAMDMTGLDLTSFLAAEAKLVPVGSTRRSDASPTGSRRRSDASPTGSRRGSDASPDDKVATIKNVAPVQHPQENSETKTSGSESGSVRSGSTNRSFDNSRGEELREPLLKTEKNLEGCGQSRGESPKTSTSSSENSILEPQSIRSMRLQEDVKPKRLGSRRARMLDLGKKMGEKWDEKKRLLEERGRHVVEKMRENAKNGREVG